MTQEQKLLQILFKNKNIKFILENAWKLNMPNWYLGAGCVAQTVWNIEHNFEPSNGIKDYDIVYYDATDITSEAQNYFIGKGKKLFKDIPIEIVNEARVHLWYEEEFGKKIKQYKSVEEAIDEWPTTATGIGVRCDKIGKVTVYAPFGLDDLFNLIVRPNKVKITKDIYEAKVGRWINIWSHLQVIPWD